MNNVVQKKILVVDDKADNLSLISSLLTPHYEVYLANNGDKSFEIANKLTPDLILLDIMMPGISGFEVCEMLKENENTANIPVIFLTARNSGEDYETAYELGGVDFVTKPINAKELLARVNTYLLIHQQYEQLEKQNKQIADMNSTLEDEVIKRTSEFMDAIAKLKKRNKELEEASYVISHNLRGPVASIMGLCQLYDKTKPAEENSSIIHHLFDSCTKLDEITKDLVEIVSFHETRIPPFENIRLKNVLEEMVKELKSKGEIDDDETVEFEFDENLSIYSARTFLTEVFEHLFSNAIKFKSRVKPKIQISAKKQNGLTRIEITDNGTGVDEKHLPEVFFPFKRFAVEKPGKGLGLYKVKNLIEAMKGEVYMESKVGHGTKVSLVLNGDIENQ